MSTEPVDDGRVALLEAQLSVETARADRAEAELRTGPGGGVPTLAFGSSTLDRDLHYGLARACLWLVTLGTLGFLLISFPAYIAIAHEDPPFGTAMDPTLQGVVMAILVDIFMCPMGIAALVALVGLRRQKRYGWIAALISFGIGVLFCTPIGVYGLFALLRTEVRQVFYPPATRPSPHSSPTASGSGFTPPP